MISQGYKPEPERQGFISTLFLAIVTCLGIGGLVLLVLGWAGKFL